MAAVIQYGVILYQMHLGKKVLPKNDAISRRDEVKNVVDCSGLSKLDRISFVLFPVASVILAFIYWIYHLS